MTDPQTNKNEILALGLAERLAVESPGLVHHLRWNSYLSVRHKLLYVSTPKVACTTLKWWFASLEGYAKALHTITDSSESDPELVVHESHKVAPQVTGLPLEALSDALFSTDYFRFAVVRNPYKRLFSAWQSKLLVMEPLQARTYAESAFLHYPINNAGDIAKAFEAFLEHLAANEAPSFWDHHWGRQFDVLRPDLINYSIIGKIEQAAELSSAVTGWIGQYAPDPFGVRRANESLIPYRPEFLSPRSAELIESLYAVDFDSFGYDRTPPASRDIFSAEQMHVALQAIGLIRARHHQLGERALRIVTLTQAVSARDVELIQLREAQAALDEQLATLKAAQTARENEINERVTDLNLALSERESEISLFRKSLAERDGQKASLSDALSAAAQAATERDAKIASLSQALEARDAALAVALPVKFPELLGSWKKKPLTETGPGHSIHCGLERIFRSATKKIRASSLFDAEFYGNAYPDLRGGGVDLATHYYIHGWREHRNPSALFNTAQYLADNPDVAASGINPLVHYLKHGRREGRQLTPAPMPPSMLLTAALPLMDLADRETLPPAANVVPAYRNISKPLIEEEVQTIKASGLFDASYYVSMYTELGLTADQAVYHYCERGWQEGRNPSDEFDTQFYLETYADIRTSGMNPFLHFVTSGRNEQRHAQRDYSPRYESEARFGKIGSSIQLLAYYADPNWNQVQLARPTFKGHDRPLLPGEELGYYNPGDAKILARHASMARSHGVSGFFFRIGDDVHDGLSIGTFLDHTEIDIGLCAQVDVSDISKSNVQNFLIKLLRDPRQIMVDNRPVLMLDLNIQSENQIPANWTNLLSLLAHENIPSPFLIASNYSIKLDALLPDWIDAVVDLPLRQDTSEFGSFTPLVRNAVSTVPYGVVAAAGVMRANESATASHPIYHTVVLGRDHSDDGKGAQIVYTQFRKNEYRRWLDAAIDSAESIHEADRRFVLINAWNDWNEGLYIEPDKKGGFSRLNETARALVGLDSNTYMPKVSVVIPNYNHGAFLKRRLDSIYGQTYPNIEVIILDDCSSDDSRAVIDHYQSSYPDLTQVIYNEQNSGSAFRQWARGIKAASGDLVWIAESDDFCDDKFLATLVQCFVDEAVLLAYGTSVFVDKEEVPMDNEFHLYLEDLGLGDKWNHPYVATAHDEVRTALGIKNTIPNASGAVFRRPPEMALLDDEAWLSMRVAGDWVFYLHIIRGGKLAFTPRAINYFRRYAGSTAEATYKRDIFYREVGYASRMVAALYNVPWQVLERCRDGYQLYYEKMVGRSSEEFDRWYDYSAVVAAHGNRSLNIMVSTIGFFPGGAEILPIRMANEFKRQGHSVLLLSSNLNPRQDGVRRMLRNDVPVIETADIEETQAIIAAFGIEALNTHQWHIQKYPLARPEVFDRLKAHVASLHGMIEHGDAFAVTESQLRAADAKVTTWVYTAKKNLGPFIDLGLYDPNSPRFTKMPNGMQPPEIDPIRRAELGIPEDAFVLCCVSRAIPDKGWAEAIDAVAQARQISGQDIRLILVGNGQVYDEYCRVGVPDFVHLVGFSENSVGYYAAADMGIMLTRFKSESFPLTIVDCLFAGKPYIATSVGEIRNMLSDGDDVAGAVVELDDWEVPVDAVADVIAKFAERAEDYAQATAMVGEIAQRYRIDVVAAKYVELFAARRDSGRLGDNISTH